MSGVLSLFCVDALMVYMEVRLQEGRYIDAWQDSCDSDKKLILSYRRRLTHKYGGDTVYPEDWDHNEDPELLLWIQAEAVFFAKIRRVVSRRLRRRDVVQD